MTTTNSTNWNGSSNSSATATCTETVVGTTLGINDITSPGCYSCNWNGALLRVNENCFDSSGHAYFTISCNDSLTVTYLSDNPYCPIGECRTIAKTTNTTCNF